MQKIAIALGSLLIAQSPAWARCTGPNYNVRLGTEISLHRESDGGRCSHNIKSSRDPIYGSAVKVQPRHGSIEESSRTRLVYRPAPGYKGEDSYTFQWVGKQNGVTPAAMTINVTVVVK